MYLYVLCYLKQSMLGSVVLLIHIRRQTFSSNAAYIFFQLYIVSVYNILNFYLKKNCIY